MKLINELPQFDILMKDLDEGRCVLLSGCAPSAREHILSSLADRFDFLVIAAPDEQKASEIISSYSAFDRNVCYYPALDPMFFKADIQGNYLKEQRIEAVRRIYEGSRCAVVTEIEAFCDILDAPERIAGTTITISQGDELDTADLSVKLVSLGYEHETQVTGRGEFSVRGNIIDIFPYASNVPYRLELFGDEVETIKTFDTGSQRSQDTVEQLVIFPGGDSLYNKDIFPENSGGKSESREQWSPEKGLLRYFEGKKVLFVLDEPSRMIKNALGMNPLNAASLTDDSDVPAGFSGIDLENQMSVIKELTRRTCIILSSFGELPDGVRPFRSFSVNSRNIMSYNGRFLDMVEDLRSYRKKGYRVVLECAGSSRAENMIKNLADNGITVGRIESDQKAGRPGSDIQVRSGAVKTGFEYPDIKFCLMSEVDIFGAVKTKRRRKKYSGDPIREFSDLNIGDYVVHEQHGVGIYQGIERIKSEGIEKDYMKIGYANNASLYVLATQFDKIQKYGGKDGAKPKINKLGGKEWANTKARVRNAVQDIAQELVDLYASRQSTKGFRYSQDTVWQREFEESFEYEETEDQLKAIEEIKEDMESDRIMDRLICGDVGFGKTEIAIRAAFKAVQDGKQAAFLTPTTILAQQHYNTLCRRLENYPVTVKMLSRFAGTKEQNAVLKDLESGKADIVVGTHRLLSKDVKFRDLGLLIVDEEQRFGVAHKEKIKQMRKNVDVITLSATPIPRTLHMSLTGIRDMSILTQPPVDRVPIQTYVMEYSKEAVREAIMRECARNGQVYYVYNRTNNIDMIAAQIQEMVPHLNVEFAHGQMPGRDLERIMFDFINGDIDVLVSTTIIETGLDIPNVNTIIIHDADNYGLSQLYQLRGRVGRSSRTAYAFLMYRKDKLIREVAEKRLKAIREFSDLGSGIRIAMRDLEIRGAGNVLGAQQSGHMEAVGYELFCKMLNQAVASLKGEKIQEDFETTVDLDIDGYIPDSYIEDEYEKLNMYKKISAISDEQDMEDISSELEDRFSDIPEVTRNLLNIACIKAAAHKCYVTDIENARNETSRAFRIAMLPDAPVDTWKMLDIIRCNQQEMRFVTGKDQHFIFAPKTPVSNLEEIKKTLMRFFDIIKPMLEDNSTT